MPKAKLLAVLAAAFTLAAPVAAQAAPFQRMFPGEVDDPSTDQALVELTRFDNPLTPAANDGPMVDSNADENQNCDLPLLVPPSLCTGAGFTYLGQFLDHDVTRDTAPLPTSGTVDPTTLENARTSEVDLDTVYSVGAEGLDPADPAKFRLGTGGRDLPRRAPVPHPFVPGALISEAIIGDPRNDENQVIAQIHVAFLRLHNANVDEIRKKDKAKKNDKVFDEARDATILEWQRVVFNDLVPRFVGPAAMQRAVERSPEFWNPGAKAERARMPVEFAAGCWRVGHTNFRLAYRLAAPNGTVAAPPAGPQNIQVFNGTFGANDLTGGVAIPPARFINWPNFFQFPGQLEPVNAGRKFDTFVSRGGFQLPAPAAIPGGTGSLPERNLVRARGYELPSYEQVARRVGVVPVANPLPAGHGTEMPLWFGMLWESQLAGGRTVGPTCGIVIADVFVELLRRSLKVQPLDAATTDTNVNSGDLSKALPPLTTPELLIKAGVGPA
jgi:hypothetical protein